MLPGAIPDEYECCRKSAGHVKIGSMVHVKMYNLLAERSLSGRERYDIPYRQGLRPVDIIRSEGFRGEEEEAIVVIINDSQGGREDTLQDGDQVEFLINMVGG